MNKMSLVLIGIIASLSIGIASTRADTFDADFSGLTLTTASDGGSGSIVTVSGPGNYNLWNKTLNTHATGSISSGNLLTFDLVGSTIKSIALSANFGKYSLTESFSGSEAATGNLAAFQSVSGASASLPNLYYDDPILTSNAYFTLDTSGGHSQLDVNFVAPTPIAGFGVAAIFMALAAVHFVRRFAEPI